MSRLLKVASVFLFLPKLDMWGLEKLPKDVESSFYAGVHEVVGCEGCHLPGLPDRISRSEIPTNCGDCHPDQHDDYTISVHAEGDRPAAVCTDCHGLHGIKRVRQPDSKVHRSLVCASCHIGPGEEFEKGPHSSAMEKSGAPACASCHGNHAVKRPTIAVVEPACEVCHTSESSPFQFGQQVESLLASFRDSLVATRQRTDRANAANLNVHAPEVLLLSAEAGYKRGRLVWHSLDWPAILSEIEVARQDVREADTALSDLWSARRLRRYGLLAFWVIVILNVLLLAAKLRNLNAEKALPR